MTLLARRLALLSVTLAVTLSIAVAAVEIGVRLWSAETLFHHTRGTPPHPFLQILPADLDHLNSNGFRGDGLSLPRAPRSFRLFTLGGSTTLGVNNSYEDTYPFILEELLRARYPDVTIEVENAGMAWYSTAHLLVNYELRVQPYHPDVVIVFEAINDLYRSFSPEWWANGAYKPDYSHYLGPYAGLLGPLRGFLPDSPDTPWSHLLSWRTLRRRLQHEPVPYMHGASNIRRLKTHLTERDVTEFRSIESFRRYYDLLLRIMQSDGVTVLVASQPFLYRESLSQGEMDSLFFAPVFCEEHGAYPTLASMTRGMEQFNAVARMTAASHDEPFLDFESAVPKTAIYFKDDVHLTRRGNEILARVAYDWIVEHGLVTLGST